MKQNLNIGVGQSLTLTPQLQHAIRLLQLSTAELVQEIEQAITTNPLLEYAELELDVDASSAENANESTDTDSSENSEISETDFSSEEESLTELSLSAADDHEIPDQPESDFEWEDLYPNQANNQNHQEGDHKEFEPSAAQELDLREHLLWQLRLLPLSESDQAIALILIDSINEDGFLNIELSEVQQLLDPDQENISSEDILVVLHQIQHLDPIGIAARNLQECMQLQLQALAQHDSTWQHACYLINECFDLLSQKNINQIQRKTKWSEAELQKALMLVRSLNPRPGAKFATKHSDYIVADLTVKKKGSKWIVELNESALPRLRVNHQYSHLMKNRDNDERASQFIKHHLQEARWLLKSIQSRNETLLRTACAIMEYQHEFLENGPLFMRPLILHDIADKLSLHESTISRVTTQKYILTPQGVFELKYFFSSQVKTEAGGGCSSTAIRAMIKHLIEHENRKQPLSDNQITELLKKDGINVARRTVTKYRESMQLPSSSERKSLA